MEVTNAGVQPQKPILQNLFRATFATLCLLIIIAIWCIYQYCDGEGAAMANFHTTMTPTYTYFDKNRAYAGIVEVQMVAETALCPDTTMEKLDIYHWPGNDKGYTTAGKYYKGTAAGASTYLSAGAIPAHGPQTAYNWRGKMFCVRRAKPGFMTRTTTTGVCAAPQIACSECECSTSGTTLKPAKAANIAKMCPISTWQLSTGAVTGKAKCSTALPTTPTPKNQANSYTYGGATKKYEQYCSWGTVKLAAYMVDMSVEMFGTPCIDPAQRPAPTVGSGPWVSILKGGHLCNALTFGSDTTYALAADTYTIKEFVTNNPKVLSTTTMGTLHGAYTGALGVGANNKAVLYSRHRIENVCSKTCHAFKIGPTASAMYKQMQATYQSIRTLIWLTSLGGGLVMCYAFYLIFIRSDAKQDEYFHLWAATMLLAVVCTILLALLVCSMRTNYNKVRAGLAAGAGCITDPTWKKVPAKMFAMTSMDSEHNWAIFWMVGCILEVLGMAYVMYTSSQQLENLGNFDDRNMY